MGLAFVFSGALWEGGTTVVSVEKLICCTLLGRCEPSPPKEHSVVDVLAERERSNDNGDDEHDADNDIHSLRSAAI